MTIINGAPQTQYLGVKDSSGGGNVYDPEVLPTHLPHVFIYAEDGPLTPQLVVGDSLVNMYGSNTFDLRSKYANHATVLVNELNARGNSVMVQRIKPKDAKPNANVRISLDLLGPVTKDEYKRLSSGLLETNSLGQYIPTGNSLTGYIGKWVTEHIELDSSGVSLFGQGNERAGDQVDAATGLQSRRYPMFDLEVSHFGDRGNNVGIRMWAPTTRSAQPVDSTFITKDRAYPFRIACIRRADASSTAKVVQSNSAEQFIEVALKPGAVNTSYDTEMYVGDQFIDRYSDLDTSTGRPPKYGPFGRIHVYQDNVDSILEKLYNAEVAHYVTGSDFNGEVGEKYRFNLFGATHSNGAEYATFSLDVSSANSTRLSELTNIYATGGSDGTMNDQAFAESVAVEVAEYANPDSVLMDDAYYPQSVVYDTGFPLETKYELIKTIAIRKDTSVILATHVVGGKELTASEESALAIALRTRLQMFPESSYYGTSTLRGCVVGRSGVLISSQYRKRLPLTIELAAKAASYMGAGNGKWKSGESFDRAPGSILTLFKDINVTFTPVSVRNKDWDNGLIWVQNYNRRSVQFPALRTVYPDDTSVLTSFFNMMICVELQKVGGRCHREFVGSDQLTNDELIKAVNDFYNDNTVGRFDNRCVVTPITTITGFDKKRGYSWTTVLQMYAPNMKSVQTLTVEAKRLDDLATA